MEKTSKDIVNTSLTISKRLQPIKPATQSTLLEAGRKTSMHLLGRGRDDKENRSIRQQSPQVKSSQVPFQETLDDSQVNIAGYLVSFPTGEKLQRKLSDPTILQMISGYKLPFKHHPPLQNIEPSVHLLRAEELTYRQEITSLCSKGAIELVLD